MSTSSIPVSDPPVCPVCQGALGFVRSTGAGGRFRWEVAVYACPHHGPIYRTRQGMKGHDSGEGDRDSIVGAPLRPLPTPTADAASVPEPD